MNTCSDIYIYIYTYVYIRILLYSGCIYMIVMGSPATKLQIIKDTADQWNTQTGILTTNLKVKMDFTLPEFSATKIVR